MWYWSKTPTTSWNVASFTNPWTKTCPRNFSKSCLGSAPELSLLLKWAWLNAFKMTVQRLDAFKCLYWKLQIIPSQPLPVEFGVKSELRIPEKRIWWFIRPYRMIVMKLSEKSCFLKCHDVFLSWSPLHPANLIKI